MLKLRTHLREERRNLVNTCNHKLTRRQVEAGMAQHEGLIHAFIRRQGGGEVSYEEALQAGREGLWHALQGYDPARGTAFSTYAWVAICHQIHQRGRELNREAKIWRGEVATIGADADPERWIEEQVVQEAVLELVGRLPTRLRRVIVCRYGLGDQERRTLREIGVELQVTRERVRQLQQEALAWLRHPAHSVGVRQLLGKNTAADYRQALAENAALRRWRRGKR
jgi:RNA polymerase sigma factor (sigma-70 family)